MPLNRYPSINLYNQKNEVVDKSEERFEQYLVYKYIKPDGVVLEIGGRYGIVSNTINLLLDNKTQHIVIEPDKSVIGALNRNKRAFRSEFIIVDKAISNSDLFLNPDKLGSNTTTIKQASSIDIETITAHDFFEEFPLEFNVLIVDCEGCFENFIIENFIYLNKLELIIFEKDGEFDKGNYDNVYKILEAANFIKCEIIELGDPEGFKQVWIKKLV